MEVLHVSEALHGKRLDIALTVHDKVSSRAEAQRIIKSGSLTINNSTVKISPNRKVIIGDLISFSIPDQEPSTSVPIPGNLDIVFEDDYLVVINKPKGMVVHPAAGHFDDTLVNYLLHHTKLANSDPIRPGVVHRIDKDTSGLLVVAKSLQAHESLAKQFSEHSIARRYQAICWGEPDRQSGTIDEPLGRHPVDRKKFAIRENGKEAVTHWKLIESFEYLSLIECQLETGRTHQIRVHLNSIGHSILGDPVYGRYRNFGTKIPRELEGLLKNYNGQALHAKRLGFLHPHLDEWMEFESEIPEDMRQVLNALENI